MRARDDDDDDDESRETSSATRERATARPRARATDVSRRLVVVARASRGGRALSNRRVTTHHQYIVCANRQMG
jgi:hypothetical protein